MNKPNQQPDKAQMTSPPPQSERVLRIPERMKELAEAIEHLRESVNQLGDRLYPVLRRPDSQAQGTPAENLDTPDDLGDQLNVLRFDVNDTNTMIADMLDRLEL
jgi:hypothetical protein